MKLKMERPTLTGDDFRLVPFTEKHLHSKEYLKWLNDREIIQYARLDYKEKTDLSEAEKYVNLINSSESDLFFAIEVNDEFIGTFKIGHINQWNKTADLGIMVGNKDYWGKGMATKIFEAAIDYCFNILNLRKVTCGCTELNKGMQKVAQKLGFKQEGFLRENDLINGKFWGHYYYGLLKEEWKK